MKAKRKFDFDVAVLGGGSAGFAAARTVANAGLKTVIIEGGKKVAGLCILRGCMPSKALLYAAEVLHLARRGETWGLKIKSAGFDFPSVMKRKIKRIAEFADYRQQQLENGKFKFFRANACFLDEHTVELKSVAGRARQWIDQHAPQSTSGKLTAKYFVIATGSVISPPPLPALTEAGYITSDEALSLKKLPRSLIVLGGGSIGCELAQFFARFDVKVTMVQRSEHILKEFDSDATQVIEAVLRREGITLFTNTRLLDARRDGKRKIVMFDHGGKVVRAEADEILFALGRFPNTTTLGLQKAGVKTSGRLICVNDRMQTSAPNIYAAGDCCGLHEIVHIAVQQGETSGHNLAHPRTPRAMDYRLTTSIVFTDPQIAAAGLTETDAAAREIPFLAASYPFNDHGKSLIMETLDGFVKLLANPKSGEILGGCCVGPMAGELIHEIIAAMAKRMTVHELAAMPHYHPTLAEIWTYPAEELAERIPLRL